MAGSSSSVGVADLVTRTSCDSKVPVKDCQLVNKNRVSEKCKALYKCKSCNSTQVMLHKMFIKEPALKESYKAVNKEDRKQWLADHHQEFEKLTLEHLKKSVKELVSHTATLTTTRDGKNSFATHVDWLDEVELAGRFQGRQDLVENTKKNAQQMTCQYTQRVLYGVPQYTSNVLEATSHTAAFVAEAHKEAEGVPQKKKPRKSLSLGTTLETCLARLLVLATM